MSRVVRALIVLFVLPLLVLRFNWFLLVGAWEAVMDKKEKAK